MSGFQTYGDYRRQRDGGQEREPNTKKRRIAPPREEEPLEPRSRAEPRMEGEDSRSFRPTMLSFKAFLATQDDSITDDEAIDKYAEYKVEFSRQQLNEFFVAHKEEEWFREKYHPELQQDRNNQALSCIKNRFQLFMELYNNGNLKELRLEEDSAEDIETFLDCFVTRLEGGTEEDVQDLINKQPLQKELHKTTSIHLRTIHPFAKREEVEALCKKYPGFLRLSLSDPQPDKKWVRKGWASFSRDAKIKEICLSLSSVRLKDMELSPVLNKDLSRRIRAVPSLSNDKKCMRNDIKLASSIIKLLDRKWELWESKVDAIVGETSANPLLENITEYLIEEMSAEEDELLGYRSQEPGDQCIERDEELTAVLDRLLLYLRLVHSVDYYNAAIYATEDEMPNRCGIFHVRKPSTDDPVKETELNQYVEETTKRMKPLLESTATLTPEEALKLGAKNETDAIEIFIQANTEELGNDKFLCPLSGKKFKGADFVRKHIFNKHAEKVENVKKDVEFFNNFIRDPKRPNLPEKPKPAVKPVAASAPRAPVREPPRETERGSSGEGRPRGSIKDRLGYKSSAMRVSHAGSDPRGMVDYSDVDFNDDLF